MSANISLPINWSEHIAVPSIFFIPWIYSLCFSCYGTPGFIWLGRSYGVSPFKSKFGSYINNISVVELSIYVSESMYGNV